MSGISTVIGSGFNDSLSAGSVPDVALTGGPGDNVLFGTGAGDSVVESIASNYTLTTTNKSATNYEGTLTGTGGSSTITDGLFGISVANLVGASPADNYFNVSGWNGGGSLTSPAGIGTVIASKNATFLLSNSTLRTSDGMSLSLNGINDAILTGTGNDNIMTVSYWTGDGSLSDTSGLVGVTVENSSVTLTDSYVTAGPMFLALSGFITADLTELSSSNQTTGGYTFNVSGWTHQGFLEGFGITSVTASESANITMTNAALTSGSMFMGLSGITAADLTVTAAAGSPSLIVNASAFSGTTSLTASGTVDGILFGGSGSSGTLAAAGSGNDVLIGASADTTLSDTGTGRNILIGAGAGGDNLVGNGNDILVSGTTVYDSYSNANLAAWDAILAEWSSSSSYSLRINRIKRGVGPNHSDKFNSSTIHIDSNANTLSDRNISLLQTDSNAKALARSEIKLPKLPHPSPQPQSNNWFIVSRHDHVTKKSNETETII